VTITSEQRHDVLARFANIAPAERGGRRAAHKPLLLLWALGRLQSDAESEFAFADVEKPVDILLGEFGPPWRTTALYPFWHLQSDDVWQVENAAEVERRKGKDRPTLRAMRNARGGLVSELVAPLSADPSLISDAAQLLLEQHFEVSLHQAIASACGLDLGGRSVAPGTGRPRRRDAAFRSRVLVAYEFQCAACGWSAFLGRDPLGLDAAHLRWHALGGPDSLDNGLCLCSLHHVALDRGALSVAHDGHLLVSAEVHTRSDAGSSLTELAGRPLRMPQAGMPPLRQEHLAWHREQVFRGPARGW
jgi:putative restriction endonuclease